MFNLKNKINKIKNQCKNIAPYVYIILTYYCNTLSFNMFTKSGNGTSWKTCLNIWFFQNKSSLVTETKYKWLITKIKKSAYDLFRTYVPLVPFQVIEQSKNWKR